MCLQSLLKVLLPYSVSSQRNRLISDGANSLIDNSFWLFCRAQAITCLYTKTVQTSGNIWNFDQREYSKVRNLVRNIRIRSRRAGVSGSRPDLPKLLSQQDTFALNRCLLILGKCAYTNSMEDCESVDSRSAGDRTLTHSIRNSISAGPVKHKPLISRHPI